MLPDFTALSPANIFQKVQNGAYLAALVASRFMRSVVRVYTVSLVHSSQSTGQGQSRADEREERLERLERHVGRARNEGRLLAYIRTRV